MGKEEKSSSGLFGGKKEDKADSLFSGGSLFGNKTTTTATTSTSIFGGNKQSYSSQSFGGQKNKNTGGDKTSSAYKSKLAKQPLTPEEMAMDFSNRAPSIEQWRKQVEQKVTEVYREKAPEK